MESGAEKDARALELFKAATPIESIRTQLGFRSSASAEKAIQRGLRGARAGKDAGTLKAIEVERVDTLFRVFYPKALRGDEKALDRCLALSARRDLLMGADGRDRASILAAYERSVDAVPGGVADVDLALIEGGRAVASQIDFSVRHGTAQEATKALYLLPHLMNVLRELGATPASRGEVQQAAAGGGSGGESELDRWRRERLSG